MDSWRMELDDFLSHMKILFISKHLKKLSFFWTIREISKDLEISEKRTYQTRSTSANQKKTKSRGFTWSSKFEPKSIQLNRILLRSLSSTEFVMNMSTGYNQKQEMNASTHSLHPAERSAPDSRFVWRISDWTHDRSVAFHRPNCWVWWLVWRTKRCLWIRPGDRYFGLVYHLGSKKMFECLSLANSKLC